MSFADEYDGPRNKFSTEELDLISQRRKGALLTSERKWLDIIRDLLPLAEARALRLRTGASDLASFAEGATPADSVDEPLRRARMDAEAATAAVERARQALKGAGHAS